MLLAIFCRKAAAAYRLTLHSTAVATVSSATGHNGSIAQQKHHQRLESAALLELLHSVAVATTNSSTPSHNGSIAKNGSKSTVVTDTGRLLLPTNTKNRAVSLSSLQLPSETTAYS